MIGAGRVLACLCSAALLGGMMLTEPDYNSVFRPFVTHVAASETGETRLFAARFTGWQTAESIDVASLGQELHRDTEGRFLIVDLELTGTISSTSLAASWQGASGRRYDTTKRISSFARDLRALTIQPGLQNKAVAVFELPADEIAGGRLILEARFDPPLEGTLHLAPPGPVPADAAVVRLDG
ncbi:DUF4352 domain-containing protein [Paracoccus aminophilus]|uniref:DUF4352 domain-containing protein n=1 Tax=Paracoccus aminophilus JCM 7686 TaxID=1367847 RepID=S5YCJ5_PARAH|nr:hypothetical protein [Paracoccus aminophilus]AGT09158.1 hypothetical protein JCM7686_2077 [Paracoccus aminophilus JCM 7686]